jgi:WD40 repeat protein
MFPFKPSILLATICVLGLSSSLHADGLKVAALDRKTEINFNKEIYPFFKRNCLACHNKKKAKAKLILETAEDIRKGSSDGQVLVPGKAEESLLFTTSAHLEEDVMPPENNKSKAKNLTPQELALLKLWINQGGKGSGAVLAEAPKEWLKSKTNQPIYALAVSPDGRYAASGRGQQVDIYDIKLQKHLARLIDPALKSAAHLDLVRSLAFDEEGTLASGGYRIIKLWNASSMAPQESPLPPQPKGIAAISRDKSWRLYLDEKPTELKRWSQNGKVVQQLSFPEKISSVAILQDQKQIALGFDSGTIRVIKIELFDQKAPAKPAPPKAPAKAPAGKPVAKAPAPKPLVHDKNLFYDLKGHGKGTLQFISEEKYPLVSACSAGKVIIWDLKTKKAKTTFNHGGGLKHFALQSKVNRLITTSDKGKALLWDLSIPAKYLLSLGQDPNIKAEIERLTINKTVANGNISRATALIKSLEETTKKELESSQNITKEIPAKETELKASQKKATELSAVKPPAKEKEADKQKREDTLKVSKDDVQKIISKIASLKVNKARAVVMHGKAVKSLAQAKVDKTKLEAHLKSLDEKLKASNEIQSKTVPQYPITDGEFSSDGLYFAVAYASGNIHLYGSETGIFIESIITKTPLKKVFFQKEDALVTIGVDGKTMSWPTQRKWNFARKIGDGKDGKILIDRVTALGFGLNSTLVSASGIPSRKGQLKLWDKKTLKLKAKNLDSHTDLITSINFSPERNQFVTGSSDGTAKIFELATLKNSRSLEGHSLAVLDASWSADGRLIATGSADGRVVLWNTDTGEVYKTVTKTGEEVTIVKFMSKASEGLLTAQGGKLLKANSKNLPGEFKYAYSASLSPDGSLILAGGLSGTLRLWDAKKYSLLKSFEPLP